MAEDPFGRVKSEVDLLDYLVNHVELEMFAEGRLEVACCPFHQENSPSFKVSEGGSGYKVWRCYGGCRGSEFDRGSIIDFVMREQGFDDPIDAVRYIDELYDLGIEYSTGTDYQERRQRIDQARSDIQRAQDAYNLGDELSKAAEAYLHGRGFTDEVIEHFKLGVTTERRLSSERTMTIPSGRISIPFYDHANSPLAVGDRAIIDGANCLSCQKWVEAKNVGAAYRKQRGQKKRGQEITVDYTECPHCHATGSKSGIGFLREQDPKYWFPRGFDKSNHLYNEHGAIQALKRDKAAVGLFLTEGQADVWAVWASGQKAVMSYNGSQLSAEQAAKVAKIWQERAENGIAKPVILVPDFDKAGLPMVRENIRLLRDKEPRMEIRVMMTLGQDSSGKDYKDPGEVLPREGAEELSRILREKNISASEWLIRDIVLSPHPHYPDQRLNTKERQQELVALEISSSRHAIEFEDLVPWLAREWNRSEELTALFFRSYTNSEVEMGSKHLITTIEQAQTEAEEMLANKYVIPHGIEAIDNCMPQGGAKLQQLSMFLGKSGTGKTMFCTQVMMNMARKGIPSIFFSLEQPPGSLYVRMVCQTLDVSMDEAAEMVENRDPRLEEMKKIFKNFIIINNVPNADGIVEPMTASRIQKTIQEVNMLKLEEPAQFVAIDHLGFIRPPTHAPSDVRNSPSATAGYVMEELFSVCKVMNVYMMVLQQLPKNIPPGEEFGYDSGKGGAGQTEVCDYVFCAFRPEMKVGLEDAEKRALAGQYILDVGKNRHGPAGRAHLWFDKRNLRILPALQVGINKDDVPETMLEGEVGPTTPSTQPVNVLIPTNEPSAKSSNDEGTANESIVEQNEETASAEALLTAEEPTTEDILESMKEIPSDNQELIDALSSGNDDLDKELAEWWES